MKIKIAAGSGFCFGVRRAIKIAEEAALEKSGVYTLGPIIHNPQEVERLRKLGIKILKTPSLKKGVLILRTHGIPMNLHRELEKKKDVKVIDAICPFVKRAQNTVRELSSKDGDIVIVGEKEHPEVKALLSYGNKRTFVLNSVKEAEKLDFSGGVNIVSQTTQSIENFNAIVSFLSSKYKTAVYNTICKSTFERQFAASKLAKETDLMIVIGGKNSANTLRLAQICSRETFTRHIETEKDLKACWFRGKKSAALTAGASTPDWIVKSVQEAINNILNNGREGEAKWKKKI
ncbi:MAG: 4-hydroxy-3-methylbut-2-enyl diphosphate reductase [Elusimicrobiota bacterium]|jgi:4-hydroxy-3-methylbut-2-enyl diphosphate reductase|nr:4-hydroxy-3-methylbut-2-enyl diphosphate reductase [Elusimicrobiota bacterium]